MGRDTTSLFISQREIDFLNDNITELIETVAQQTIRYYAVEDSLMESDNLYGESIKKVFRNPVEIYCRVMLSDHRMTVNNMGAENIYEIELYFQRDRVMKDLGFYPRIGDFVEWANKVFEIKTTVEPQMFGGLAQHRVGIICKAIITRQEVMNLSNNRPYNQEVNPDSELRK
jgi:hypothetical protein